MSDTTELQGLIDAATKGDRRVLVPPRTYVLDRGGRTDGGPCLTIPPAAAGLQLLGSGRDATVLRMADGSPPSTRSIYVQAPGVTIGGLTLHGGTQTDVDEHRAGVFATASGLRLLDVTSVSHTGDGFYLFTGASDASLDGCNAVGNHRNGITLGSALDDLLLTRSHFVGNGAQQVDTEPGPSAVVSGLVIHRCVLDGLGASSDFVLTLGGAGLAGTGHDVVVSECTLNGPVNVVWGRRVVLVGCTGVNPTGHPSLTMSRSGDVRVSGCTFDVLAARFGILVQGTGEGSTPSAVVEDTQVTCGADGATGIYASCVESLAVRGSSLRGNGVVRAGAAGVNVRAVTFATAGRGATVEGCDVRSFGDAGISVTGNVRVEQDDTRTYAHLDEVWARGNTFGNLPGSTSLRRGMVLDDGSQIATKIYLGPNNVHEAGVVDLGAPAWATRLP